MFDTLFISLYYLFFLIIFNEQNGHFLYLTLLLNVPTYPTDYPLLRAQPGP